MHERLEKDLAVCFSGGLDSTTIALVMGRRYAGRVHLITIDHGHGHILHGLERRHVRDLERLLGPERVLHHTARTSPEFRRLVMGRLWRDYRTYGSNFVVCLGCNLAMDVHLIAHCLEHRVPTTFFGFTPKGSDHAVMALPETTRERRRLYASFGLLYRTPLLEWHMEKPEERALLRSHGVWPGWNFRKVAMGVQPMCLLGIMIHHMDIMFDQHPEYDRTQVLAFLRDKAPLARDLVGERLAARGVDLESRVREMRALNASEWDRYGPEAPALDDRVERRETAERAELPALALRSWPQTLPWKGHAELSRDGRDLRAGEPVA